MEIKILGAAKEVTGSCFSVSITGEKVLVDCGMFQGNEELEKLNYEDFTFNTKEYSALLLTHAHLDHCGRIPKLIRSGFKGKIYATDATKELAFIVMADSAKIAIEDAKDENRRRLKENLPQIKPAYNMDDVTKAMKLFFIVEYDELIKVTKNMSAKFYDAGHILGSSSIQVFVNDGNKKKTAVFSGDLGQSHSVLMKNIEPIADADYVFMESTYGDRLHQNLDGRRKKLAQVINETHAKGGKLMIPVFAIERTQEILYYIRELMADGKIPKIPVFLDSPMATRATEVFKKFPIYFNKGVKSELKEIDDVFNFPELEITKDRKASIAINSIKTPCIVLAGSGMCTGGRIKHHILNNIEDENNTLLFVGYQVKGTLGNFIQSGEKLISLFGKEIKVRARIESEEGFSAHADKDGLLKWLNNFKGKPKVFLIHGDEEQQIALEKSLKDKGFECYIPSLNEELDL